MFALKIVNGSASLIEDFRNFQLEDDGGIYWLHMQSDMDVARNLIGEHLNIDQDTINALCDAFTRPRMFLNIHDDLVLTARALRMNGVGQNEMASIRALVTDKFLLTLSYDEIPAISETYGKLTRKNVDSRSTLHILEKICNALSDGITTHIAELDEKLTEVEDEWEDQQYLDLNKLHSVRIGASRARRYLTPQMEAFSRLSHVVDEMRLDESEKQFHISRWRELINATKRDIESITDIRERVTIVREALQHATNQSTNRIMYLLSVVATFFLPLTFIASLLGMNVGGIPIQDKPWAFWAVCGVMIVIAIFQWMLFRYWRWLK